MCVCIASCGDGVVIERIDYEQRVDYLEDENGNKIQMNSDGIEIESIGDINISAQGDVNIEGINVNAKANAQFTAEGSAGAELSAGGQTVVKGAIVQIN